MVVLRSIGQRSLPALAVLAVAAAVLGLGSSGAHAVVAPNAVATPAILAPADVIVGEKDGVVDFEVRLSDAGLNTVTVLYEASAGSAVGGSSCNSDFVDESGQLTFTPGDTSEVVSVEILDCPDVERFESFRLIFSVPVSATLPRVDTRVGVVDNDTVVATPRVFARDALVDEKDGVALVSVLLGGAAGQASSGSVEVDYATSPGTATAPDFTAASGTLTFASGETVKTVAIPIADDASDEPAESFTLDLSDASGATISDGSGSASIGASDAPAVAAPWLSAPPDVIVGEGEGFVDLAVTLSAPALEPLTVSGNTFPLNAELGLGCGGDFVTGGRVLTFAPGETTKVVRADILDCPAVEGLESFVLDLGDIPTFNVRRQAGRVGIVDNDTVVPTPNLVLRDAVVDEKDGPARVAVLLGGAGGRASNDPVSVGYATSDGSAAGGAGDYTATSGTLTFAPGETAKTLVIPIADDSATEPAESFSVALSGASGATISDGSGLVSIGASDGTAVAVPTLFTSPDRIVGEAEGYVDVVVRLAQPGTEPREVAYNTLPRTAKALTGCDGDVSAPERIPSSIFTFLPGETTKSLRLDIVDCPAPVVERLESFLVFVDANPDLVVLGRGDTQIGIVDNDTVVPTPKLVVRDAVVDEKEGFARVDVLLGGPKGQASTGSVTVDYAASPGSAGGADYTPTSGALVFAPGETVKTVLVPIADDASVEPEESFALGLSGASGATIEDGTGTVSIGPSDAAAVAAPALSIEDVTVGEEEAYVDVIVSLSAPGQSTVSTLFFTIDDTALPGIDCDQDYEEVVGWLTFEPGETTKVVRVHVIDCDGAEHLEFFDIVLLFAANATISKAVGAVGIVDEEAPTLTGISVAPANPSIHAGLTYQLTATGTYSNAPPLDVTDGVAWSSSNPAVATIDNTGLARAVSPGTTTISATLGAFSAGTVLTVSPALLHSIAITPANASLAAGTTRQLTATGTYTNGSTANLTSSVTWESSNTGVATIGGSGLARGVSPGTTLINATLGVVASTTLRVTAASVQPKPPPRCKVPKVVGKRLAAAKSAIKRGRCSTGKVTYAYSRKVKKGLVISQSRRAGKVLARNSKINLVVSRGPRR